MELANSGKLVYKNLPPNTQVVARLFYTPFSANISNKHITYLWVTDLNRHLVLLEINILKFTGKYDVITCFWNHFRSF